MTRSSVLGDFYREKKPRRGRFSHHNLLREHLEDVEFPSGEVRSDFVTVGDGQAYTLEEWDENGGWFTARAVRKSKQGAQPLRQQPLPKLRDYLGE